MVYWFAIIIIIHNVTLHCSEQDALLQGSIRRTNNHTFDNPHATIAIPHIPYSVEDHAERIKQFLKTEHGTQFQSDGALFDKEDIVRWHGLTNKTLIAHARTTLSQLQTPSSTRVSGPNASNAETTTPTTLYIEMLKDLIASAETNDKKQKKALRTKATITGIGAVGLFALQCASNYVTIHLMK